MALESGPDGESITAFRFADRQRGNHHGQTVELDRASCLDVILRGPTAISALSELQPGDAIVVHGLMEITEPLDQHNDRELVAIRVEAHSLGLELRNP